MFGVQSRKKSSIENKHDKCKTCTIPTAPNSLFIEPCTHSEISDTIEKLRNSSTSDFKTEIVKHVSNTLSEVLCPIINASLLYNIYNIFDIPKTSETAKLVPIHKSGRKHNVDQYHYYQHSPKSMKRSPASDQYNKLKAI